MTKDSSKLPNGIRRLFRLPVSAERLEREMSDEMRLHVEMRAEEYRARGLSDDEARRAAIDRFGDAAAFQSFASRRAARAFRRHTFAESMSAWWQDIQFAYRQYTKAPAFTIVALLTLALGIGANTAIFSVVHRLLLVPLPYPNGNRIVMLVQGEAARGQAEAPFPMRAWRERAHEVDMIAAISVQSNAVQTPVEDDSTFAYITPNFIEMLGDRPALGRAFRDDDAHPGAPLVAMISFGMWQRRYGARDDVIGKTISVGNALHTVVGVAPPEMGVPMEVTNGVRDDLHEGLASIWVPASLDSLTDANIFARLRSGTTAERATTELAGIVASENGVAGGAHRRTTAAPSQWRLMRAQDLLGAREKQTITVLFIAVGVLLLIACANIANLLMARAFTRRREFAVRTALGAERTRIMRQVFTESVLLALVGGLLGLAVTWETLRLIIAARPSTLDHLTGVHIEPTVLAWSIAISLGTGIIFGCAPALFASGNSVGDVLRSETRGSSGGVSGQRLRSGLIIFEIAMSLMLLVGAGLLTRSFIALSHLPLGFEPRGLVFAEVMYPARRVNQQQREAARYGVVTALRATPGVADAAVGAFPTNGAGAMGPEKLVYDNGRSTAIINGHAAQLIANNYFRVTRMSLEGRAPDSSLWAQRDTIYPPRSTDGPIEVVINRGMARRFWPNGAIGARFSLGSVRDSVPLSYVVVGVVDEAHIVGAHRRIDDIQLFQFTPKRLALNFFVARTTLPLKTIKETILRAMVPVSAHAVVRTLTRGDDYLHESLAPARFAMALFGVFALIALVLSAIGLYASIAYSVSQRTREIGVRVALGASARAIARLILTDAFKLAAVGILLGAIAAALSTRMLNSLLYGVAASDPLTFAGIICVVALIALVASYVPMRRALRIDPMEALRAD
ncbi:MAG TPA: ADOP family duplicated permease [Gemmatimonadaceae bacterium]